MTLPLFYIPPSLGTNKSVVLDEDVSRHMIQVLRLRVGGELQLTDGEGNLFTAAITDDHKKHTTVEIVASSFNPRAKQKISVCISLLKNTSRFEWFLEKATEIGVSQIIPLICERTEKQKFRFERMKQIVISAMIQSQQHWLPELEEPVKYVDYIKSTESPDDLRLIAHCSEGQRHSVGNFQISRYTNFQILIGPEGDFTNKEIDLALAVGFEPVSLGKTRLRSETAGIVALSLLNNY